MADDKPKKAPIKVVQPTGDVTAYVAFVMKHGRYVKVGEFGSHRAAVVAAQKAME